MPAEKRLSLPRGLGVGKRSRPDGPEDSLGASSGKPMLYFELEHDANQIDELQALFDAAEATVDDSLKSIPLFRGVIHECNRMQHGDDDHDGSEAEDEDDKELSPKFFCIFSKSLLNLALLETPIVVPGDGDSDCDDAPDVGLIKERCDFLRASKRKCEEGLEKHPGDSSLLETRAIATAALVASGDDYAVLELPDHLSDHLKQLNGATEAEIDFLGQVHDLKNESLNALTTKKLVQAVLSAFEDFLEEQVDRDSTVQHVKVTLINTLAEADLELGESVQAQKYLSKSISAAADCLDGVEDTKTRRQLAHAIGISYMLLGSALALNGDGGGENANSQKAVGMFESAKEMGMKLDEPIEKFVDDFQESSRTARDEKPTAP